MAKKPQTFLEKLETTFGEDVIEKDTRGERIYKVFPTGSPSLDVSIGVGGIPCGKFTEIYGPYSSAKTSLCLSTSKSAIKSGTKVLYVNTENDLDYNYIRAIVGDISETEFVLIHPEKAEQALSICESGIQSGEFGLIVLDSVAGLAPEKELEDDFGKSNYALIPRLLLQFLRRNAYTVRKSNIAFIFVNQVRDNIGSYVKSYETPGGHGLKHYSSLRIQLGRSENIEVEKEIVGFYSRFTIKKNKVGRPFRSHSFPFFFGKGIDTVRDLVEFSEMLGIVERRGAYYTFEGEVLGQGITKTKDKLLENPETLDKLTKMCYNINNKREVILEERIEEEDEENLNND